MSGEKRAVADLSWEFTVGLVRGILIGSSIVRGRSCMGGRQAACWETVEGRGGGAGAAGVGTGTKTEGRHANMSARSTQTLKPADVGSPADQSESISCRVTDQTGPPTSVTPGLVAAPQNLCVVT